MRTRAGCYSKGLGVIGGGENAADLYDERTETLG